MLSDYYGKVSIEKKSEKKKKTWTNKCFSQRNKPKMAYSRDLADMTIID